MNKSYTTQMDAARKGILTSQMMQVLENEAISQEALMEKLALGHIAIPCNQNHRNIKAAGDGLRPGSIKDSTDAPQIEELITLGELTKKAWERNVQVIIEGPGHVPLHEIEMNMQLQKKLCHNAPFYVLGPLVTDIAPGYDHITSAIGGALAAMHGADFLCYVTPAEHLRLPSAQDVKDGIMASKIAAHAGDLAKGIKDAQIMDNQMSRARGELDWEGQFACAIDPEKAREYRKSSQSCEKDVCTMCGDFCAVKRARALL